MIVSHPRTAIRKKAVELLMGNTGVGASVYVSRVAPFIVNDWDNQLPAISVYTMDEAGEIHNAAPREYRRTVQLAVEIQGEADEALDDVLDEIARQVELILLRDDTLDGTASDLRYSQTQMVLREQGKTVIGACRIIFDADYLDEQPGPDFNETLDDLATVHTDYSLAGEQDDPADRANTHLTGLNE